MPRYVMGVGYPEDIVICVALGTDMFDCVYPTRISRFGRMFSDNGDILINNKFQYDLSKNGCSCFTCPKYSLGYLSMIRNTTNFCTLVSTHNLFYMRTLTKNIREAIKKDKYPELIKKYMIFRYKKVQE